MTSDEVLAPYRGEFRYVFYTGSARYQPTVEFYRECLDFPVVGGFGEPSGNAWSEGTYLQASVGVIEVIAGTGEELQIMLMGKERAYTPPRGGFLLVDVPDVDALATRVRAHDVTIMSRDDVLIWQRPR